VTILRRASGNDAWWQPPHSQQSSAHPPQQMPNHVVPTNLLPFQLNALNAQWQQLQQSKLSFCITLHFPRPSPNLMLLCVPRSPGNLNYCNSLMQSAMSMPNMVSNMLTEANRISLWNELWLYVNLIGGGNTHLNQPATAAPAQNSSRKRPLSDSTNA